MKNKTAVVLIIIIVLFSIIGFFMLKNRSGFSANSTIEAIPNSAILVIESNSGVALFNKWTRQNPMYDEWTEMEGVDNPKPRLMWVDSLLRVNKPIKKLLEAKKISMSLHSAGLHTSEWLLVVALPDKSDRKQLGEKISSLISKELAFSTHTYDNTEVYEINFTEAKKSETYIFSFVKGFFIYSRSKILIESTIRQINSGNSFFDDNAFAKVSKTSGKHVEANIYLNYSNLQRFVSGFFNKNQKYLLNFLGSFADWTALDLTMEKDAMLLNGFTYAQQNPENYLNILKQQSPIVTTITDVIPANTTQFIAMGISDRELFDENFKTYSEHLGSFQKTKSTLKQLKSKYKVDFQEIFTEIFEQELALVYTPAHNSPTHQAKFAVLQVKNRNLAEEKLLEALKKYAQKDTLSLNSLISTVSGDKSFKIYKNPFGNLPEMFFGKLFSDLDNSYFTFVNDYLVFAQSANLLSDYIFQTLTNKTLAEDAIFTEYSSLLHKKSSLLYYASILNSANYLKTYLTRTAGKQFRKNVKRFKKLRAIAVQFTAKDDFLFTNTYLKYYPKQVEQNKTGWTVRLDTISQMKPVLLLNHYTKNKEVFIQDENNKIYLIDHTGNRLWNRQLDEKIISKIHFVDIYKNDKIQMLFNTENHLYLLDRNGKDVENYPIKLPYPATNALSVLDYENNKNYRLFIACLDNQIYVYDVLGKPISGWDFKIKTAKIESEIQHFRNATKDYLVFSDTKRAYLLNRRGEERLVPDSNFYFSAKNRFYYEGNSGKPHLVNMTKSGKLVLIYFDGKVKTKQIAGLSGEHFFAYYDLDSDGSKDYIVLNNNKLQVYNRNFELTLSYEFEQEIKKRPLFFTFSTFDKRVGLQVGEQIYLINGKGKLNAAFPLNGSTLFSIGKLDKTARAYNLIVGSKDGYLYNYALK